MQPAQQVKAAGGGVASRRQKSLPDHSSARWLNEFGDQSSNGFITRRSAMVSGLAAIWFMRSRRGFAKPAPSVRPAPTLKESPP